jgi:hypothetical protein
MSDFAAPAENYQSQLAYVPDGSGWEGHADVVNYLSAPGIRAAKTRVSRYAQQLKQSKQTKAGPDRIRNNRKRVSVGQKS